MPDTPPAALPARLRLTLQRNTTTPGWKVEVHNPGAPRRFASLTELMAWLSTLDPPPPSSPPSHGIR